MKVAKSKPKCKQKKKTKKREINNAKTEKVNMTKLKIAKIIGK